MSYVIDQKSYVMSMSLCVTCVTCDDMSYVICHMSICQYVCKNKVANAHGKCLGQATRARAARG